MLYPVVYNIKTLKQKCHFDNIFIIDCTASYQNDNFLCSQLWKFRQNDIYVSVNISISSRGVSDAWSNVCCKQR